MERITVRFAENEILLLKQEAKKKGVSLSQYVRDKVIGNINETLLEKNMYDLQQDNKKLKLLLSEVIKILRMSVNASYAVLKATDPEHADVIMQKIKERLDHE